MIKTTNLNYNVEKEYYLLPKYYVRMAFATNDLDNALDNIEDYKLKNLSEETITDKIKEYNKEKDLNVFERLKAKDFSLVEKRTTKIGKYKYSRIAISDYTK